jgi:hypothetical protein
MDIKHAERINGQLPSREGRSAEGRPPCFDQPRCRPRQYYGCEWKRECGAHLEAARGLVLSGNVILGHQVATLFASTYGWRMQVLQQDKQACDLILQGSVDAVVADIDEVDLGGLAVLAYAKHHWPTIMTYAITEDRNPYLKRLALELGGCLGFIYRIKGRMELDARTGLLSRMMPRLGRDGPVPVSTTK